MREDSTGADDQGKDQRAKLPGRELFRRIEHGDTYVLVFVLLIISYFFLSLLPDTTTWSRVLTEVVVGVSLLIILRTSKARPGLQRFARWGVVGGFALTLIGALVGGATPLVYVVLLGLLLVTPFVILNRILRHESVTIETIAGAIDVYVLIGLIFSSLYRVVASISGTQFFAETQHPTANQYLYFSFVSLTTVGYGDLTPATAFGRSIVVLEPLLGQIFLVTTVARLVSIWPGRQRHRG